MDAERLSAIAGACRDHEGIRFNYHNRTGAPSARVVEPHRLVHTGYRWYLVAWDIGSQRLANLSRRPHRRQAQDLDSVQTAQAARGRFCSFRFQVALAGALPLPRPRHAARAGRSSSPSASRLRLECWKRSTRIPARLHTGSHSLEGITIHLSLLGVDFEVHEPPELIDYIRRLADRLARACD